MKYVLGVDVGTLSVRVGLYTQTGTLIDFTVTKINVYNFKSDFYEQSSTEIWSAVKDSIKRILLSNSDAVDDILSIGFDATCSLVILDKHYKPVAVNPVIYDSKNHHHINVIMWQDHRSNEQADFINKTNHKCLSTVGGKVSPEMDLPKILWLKQNLSEENYSSIEHFISLSDFLVLSCIKDWNGRRSICSTVCKWQLINDDTRTEWSKDFFTEISLNDLTENNFSKIGNNFIKSFQSDDSLIMSDECKKEFGFSLKQEVRIGTPLIDAHAGVLGALATTLGFLDNNNNFKGIQIPNILVLVSGTSNCIMANSKSSHFINGIWGPYYEAILPKIYLNEAGQGASGKLIDFIIKIHPAFDELNTKTIQDNNSSIYDTLEKLLNDMTLCKGLNIDEMSKLTKDLHFYPVCLGKLALKCYNVL
jgi:FGGY-family pentulose kinase